MLKHLLNTPSKKRIAQDETNFIMVINNMLANFDDRKETGKMLVYFIEECWDCSMGKVIVYLPIVYNWRLFQNLSKALLFVLQNDILRKKIVVRPEPPMSDGMLHFAMRSKSEALLLLTLRSGADVFEKNQFGVNCKFCCGTTIVCRKLVWLY